MHIEYQPLPYVERLALRSPGEIDLLVIHCTELPDLPTAREYGERIVHAGSATGNSGHYYLDRDGTCACWVPPTHVAHHVHGWNARSLGIELVNLGRYPHWGDSRHQQFSEPYPRAQIEALLDLIEELRTELPDLRWIASHAELDQRSEPATDDPSIALRRRLDPGPLFPWDEVDRHCGLAHWPG